MAFGIYVHIPYCLQRCPYCDFATYEWTQIPPPEQYVELVRTEIRQRAFAIPYKTVNTVYFGGGTPSLIEAPLIVSLLSELAMQGFQIHSDAEITIEINPATITASNLDLYRRAGINRFSVGAQTFNNSLLLAAGRKHSAEDTIATLELLKAEGVNFSFDLLFALPKQSLSMLKLDLDLVERFAPPHVSTYCLTVPENHPMQKGRAPEEEQLEMFALVEDRLQQQGLLIYEISNFAKPGMESQHNLLYWTDQSYWGIGLSAHSYLREPHWGTRFWNPSTYEAYASSLSKPVVHPAAVPDFIEPEHKELLKRHQSLTDYCHTALRLTQGLDISLLKEKFSPSDVQAVLSRLSRLAENQDLHQNGASCWSIGASRRSVSNRIFSELTFLADDLE